MTAAYVRISRYQDRFFWSKEKKTHAPNPVSNAFITENRDQGPTARCFQRQMFVWFVNLTLRMTQLLIVGISIPSKIEAFEPVSSSCNSVKLGER